MNIQIKIDNASVSQFKGIISKVVEKVMKDVLQKQIGLNNSVNGDQTLITRSEVMKMLNVSHSTLYHYQRKGIIPFLKIGNRVYFKKCDITNNYDLIG
jgi:predicted DNA-binding transcriptional regulator AlpA